MISVAKLAVVLILHYFLSETRDEQLFKILPDTNKSMFIFMLW